MPELKHTSTKIFYELSGNGGTALVLLHGFCEDIHTWDLLKPHLEKDFKILVIDLPGFGKSEVLKDTPSIESYADCILPVLEQEGITKCRLVGHSMGGYAALAFAGKYPEMLIGLGLFHSQSFADDAARKESRLKAKQFVKEVSSTRYVEELMGNLFSAGFKQQHSETVNGTIEHNRNTNPEGIIYALDAMRLRSDRSDVLKSFNKSVIHLVSDKDTVIPYSKSLEMAHFSPISEIVLLGNSAHMGMIEEPEKAAKAIINWGNN